MRALCSGRREGRKAATCWTFVKALPEAACSRGPIRHRATPATGIPIDCWQCRWMPVVDSSRGWVRKVNRLSCLSSSSCPTCSCCLNLLSRQLAADASNVCQALSTDKPLLLPPHPAFPIEWSEKCVRHLSAMRCDACSNREEKANISGTVGCKTREGSWAPDQSPSTISYPEREKEQPSPGDLWANGSPLQALVSSVSLGKCLSELGWSFHFHKISQVAGAAAGQGRKCISICSLPNLLSLKR